LAEKGQQVQRRQITLNLGEPATPRTEPQKGQGR